MKARRDDENDRRKKNSKLDKQNEIGIDRRKAFNENLGIEFLRFSSIQVAM